MNLQQGLAILGLLMTGLGVLSALEGGGVVHWPPQSAIIDHGVWIARGITMAFVGVLMLIAARRL